MGYSPWQTAMELWEEKSGIRKAKDLSDSEVVQRGNRFEPLLREMYKAQHTDSLVKHHPYDVLYQPDLPWLAATLDGEVTEVAEDGTMHNGVLEIKTATCIRKADYDKWRDGIPQHYYIQTLHQLLATGFEFVDVYAALFGMNGNISIREYRIERKGREADLDWLRAQETEFWDSVQRGIMPAQTIRI